jgi:hypothetical protein
MHLLLKLFFIAILVGMAAVNSRAALAMNIFAMSCYALKELFKLKGNEPVTAVLQRRAA